MCGLVGVAGGLTLQEEKMFKDLLIIDTIRGKDSTGVVGITSRNEVLTHKKAEPAALMMRDQEYRNIHTRHLKAMLGHNRAATFGSVIDENAHPFQHGSIIGMHNGTLLSTFNLPENKLFEVDSDNIIYSIDVLGIKETYSLLNGAAALVWWNSADDTLNFIRNNERSLFYTYTVSGKLIWASETEMIELAAFRNKVDIIDTFYYFRPHHHYSFHINKDSAKFTNDKPRLRELQPYRYQRPNTVVRKVTETKPIQSLPAPRQTSKSGVGTNDMILFSVVQYDPKALCLYGTCKLTKEPIRVNVSGGRHKDLVERFKETGSYEATGTVSHTDNTNPLKRVVVINPSSFRSIGKKKPDASEKNYTVLGNEFSEAGWCDLVEKGCLECGSVPLPIDSEDVIWFGKYSFYCSDTCMDYIIGENFHVN